MVARLADDHANARLLAEALGRGKGRAVCPVETNIVVATLEGRTAPDVVAALREGRRWPAPGRSRRCHGPRTLRTGGCHEQLLATSRPG